MITAHDVEQALALIERRVIPGTALAAYGHGDWNDALQPADPTLRKRMCSAWTVTVFAANRELREGRTLIFPESSSGGIRAEK